MAFASNTRVALMLATVAAALAGEGIAQTVATAVSRKILFVGDSLTYFQDGIDTHFERLAASGHPPLAVAADQSAFGGAFLHRLWNLKEPVKAIDTGAYDVVVLQEDLPETTVADFREYAGKFVAEVRKNHARPVLLMAWAYARRGWISMAEIAQAHREVAKEWNVDVAPVGLAWEQVSKQRPGMDLYVSDREHPSIFGTYLAACVVYATIYGRDPRDDSYVAPGVSPEQASFLRTVAWQTVQQYRAAGPSNR